MAEMSLPDDNICQIMHGSEACSLDSCPYHPRIHHMVPAGAGGVEDGRPPRSSDYRLMFHVHCDTCQSRSIDLGALCNFCRHLRIYHLVVCSRHAALPSFPLINIGPLNALQDRDCRFCSLIVHIFSSARHDRRVDVHPADPVLMYVHVQHLQSKYRRTILPPETGSPDILLFTPEQHSLQHMLQIGTERYAKVIHRGSNAGMVEENTERFRCVVSSPLNWLKMKEWVGQCIQSHDRLVASQDIDFTRLPGSFRLIDVDKCCIVNAPENPRYATLSYVWGEKTPEEIEATLANMNLLSTPGQLDIVTLSRTIVDAIAFCRKLDVRYLWVDRLCIVQDDASHKHDQIYAMDAIYSCALFTVCAAAGESSHHGIPGIRVTPRPYARANLHLADTEIVPILPQLRDCLADGRWYERGWTFQEELLGGRLILFTDWQAFCRIGVNEESEDELTESANEWTLDSLSANVPDFEAQEVDSVFNKYRRFLGVYSGRSQLSFASDAYNAFAGAFRYLYTNMDGYIYGLPERDFDAAIVWVARPTTDLSAPRRHENAVLPTWSWGSLLHWTPEIFYGLYEMIGSVAKWGRIDAKGRLKPILATNDPTAHQAVYRWESNPSSPSFVVDPRPYMVASWPVCIEAPLPILRKLRSRPHVELKKQWPKYRHFWRDAHGQQKFPISDISMSALAAEPGRIAVRTSAKTLRLWMGNRVGASQDFFILDSNGWCMGTSRIPLAIASAHLQLDTSAGDMGYVTILALSLGFVSDSIFFENLKRKAPKATSGQRHTRSQDTMATRETPHLLETPSKPPPPILMTDEEGDILDLAPVLNVMLVRYRGDIAHRIWLGQVSLARWQQCRPTFETIILE